MAGSRECLERAAALERQAEDTGDPKARAAFLTLAQGWRDLARHARARERPEDEVDPAG